MAALKQFLAGERAKGKAIFPRPRDWFAALDATPPVIGQAPAFGTQYDYLGRRFFLSVRGSL